MTIEQDRAKMAHEHVEKLAAQLNKAQQKKYATAVYQTISLVKRSGLVQALEFMVALTNDAKREQAIKLQDQLGQQMKRLFNDIHDGASLRRKARSVELQPYMALTRELMSSLLWYQRFVQSIIKVSRGTAMSAEDGKD